MVNKKTWKEFVDTGLFWWINTNLHVFGWALVREVDNDGQIKNVYPAKVKFRGFDEDVNSAGYEKITKYMKDNIDEILSDFD